jgi:HPt (histidine-containing phosphotransfer) domain-containing protein
MGDDSDEEFMDELKREFKATVSRNLVDMRSLHQERNFEDIARIAHDIKGTAGLFELQKGREIAAELQREAQKKESEKTKTLIEALAAYMNEAGIIEA